MTSKITSAGTSTSPSKRRPAPPRHETRGQAIRFLFSGGCSVLTDLGTYQLLLGAGLSPGVSKGLSFLCGVGVGYPLNKFLTFAQGPTALANSVGKTGPEMLLYLAVYAASLAVNIGVNAVVLGLVGAQAKLLGFLIATGVTTVMNFVCLKWLVFRHGAAATDLRMESLT